VNRCYTSLGPGAVSRRALLHAYVLGGAISAATTSCATGSHEGGQPRKAPMTEPTSPSTAKTTGPGPGPTTLLAYFSRPGENYYYGDRIDLKVGNTEVLAAMIAERIDCDVTASRPPTPTPMTTTRPSPATPASKTPTRARRSPTP